MKILVIGGGGREHALAWKLAESPKATKVYVAPGNGGTALAGGKLENLAITDVKALREWAQAEKIAVTVVGPEAPLAAGVVDEFRAHGLQGLRPDQGCRPAGVSKAFSKDFMARHGIPTAQYETFTDPSRPTPMWTAWARPSSSRPTAWRPARAWWWP
jgi:phosphoribosylamine--glycine ligase